MQKSFTYTYHPDGQLASANYGDCSETFAWDGLALIRRGDERFVNEPHVGVGNPIASSKGSVYFNDVLGTTVGAKQGKEYSAAALSAFGECQGIGELANERIGECFFTGKPAVEGLGYAFLMRNYRAGLAKWQTADPLGYPDGWNQLAYCGNGVTGCVDMWGCSVESVTVDYVESQKYDSEPQDEVMLKNNLESYLADGWYVDDLIHRGITIDKDQKIPSGTFSTLIYEVNHHWEIVLKREVE